MPPAKRKFVQALLPGADAIVQRKKQAKKEEDILLEKHAALSMKIAEKQHEDMAMHMRRLPAGTPDPRDNTRLMTEGPCAKPSDDWLEAQRLSLELAELERFAVGALLYRHFPIHDLVTLTLSYSHASIVIKDGVQSNEDHTLQ